MTESHAFHTAKQAVFRYLKYRPRSEQEIRYKLKEKDTPEAVIDQTVDYFKRVKLIDDAQFAVCWMRSRLNKPYGMRRICTELKLKGIADELINAARTATTGDYEEHAAILKLARRRQRQYRHVDKQTCRRRLYEYLARRGFSSSAIIKALHDLNQ